MSLAELAGVLEALGCPPGKSSEMASQLDKRARQLAENKQRSYDEALTHLLQLMRQGWAAQERGLETTCGNPGKKSVPSCLAISKSFRFDRSEHFLHAPAKSMIL